MRLLLIDGPNLVRRIHAARARGADPAGEAELREAVIASARRALRDADATHAACVFERGGGTWRHALFPGYKADRPPVPAGLRAAQDAIEADLAEIGLAPVSAPGFEADDVIATMAVRVAEHGGEVLILSTDRAFCQLVGPRIRVRDHFNHRDHDEAAVRERFGVDADRLVDWFALVGDRSLGIGGVPSVGPATATRLITEHGDLEGAIAAAERIGGRTGATLRRHADDARLAARLFRMRGDVPLELNLRQLRLA